MKDTLAIPDLDPRLAALMLLVSIAVSAPAQSAYIAPTSQSVTAKLEVSQGARAGYEVWVNNLSSVGITVTSVTLSSCQNVRQVCGVQRVNVKIPASSRRRVFLVLRDMQGQTYTFHWTYSWSAESTSTTALTALAKAGSPEAADRLDAMRHAEEVRQRDVGFADLELSTREVLALGDRIVALRAEPDSVILPMDSVFFVGQFRVLALDSLGQSLGRYRAPFRIRLDPTAVRLSPPDTILPTAKGRSVFILTPSAEINGARQKPLEPVRVTFIVP